MKRGYSNKGSKKYVVLGLLAVLFISLGALSMQNVREGMKNKKSDESKKQGTESRITKMLTDVLGVSA